MKVLVKDRRSSRKHKKCVLEDGVFSGHTFRTAIDKERLEEDEVSHLFPQVQRAGKGKAGSASSPQKGRRMLGCPLQGFSVVLSKIKGVPSSSEVTLGLSRLRPRPGPG